MQVLLKLSIRYYLLHKTNGLKSFFWVNVFLYDTFRFALLINNKTLNMATLTISRKKSFIGFFNSFDLFIDDKEYGCIQNGESFSFKLSNEIHTLKARKPKHSKYSNEFKFDCSDVQVEITISKLWIKFYAIFIALSLPASILLSNITNGLMIYFALIIIIKLTSSLCFKKEPLLKISRV